VFQMGTAVWAEACAHPIMLAQPRSAQRSSLTADQRSSRYPQDRHRGIVRMTAAVEEKDGAASK
jgi:hypothetical protein